MPAKEGRFGVARKGSGRFILKLSIGLGAVSYDVLREQCAIYVDKMQVQMIDTRQSAWTIEADSESLSLQFGQQR